MGDQKNEFERMALQHMDLAYNIALGMTRDATEAEDLVQDTYLRAYKFFDTFERETNFRAWLFTILRNTYINRYRRKSRDPQMVDISEIQMSGELVAESTPENDIFSRLLDDDVADAMNSLPTDFRITVVLSDLEGLPYKEIAEILDIPIGTVMSRLYRGRKLLRNRLREYARKRGYIRS
ncbi:sigma-70 family RNA polymerase sigma factor [Candidatus Poribacteria bacterium]